MFFSLIDSKLLQPKIKISNSFENRTRLYGGGGIGYIDYWCAKTDIAVKEVVAVSLTVENISVQNLLIKYKYSTGK